MQSLEFGSRDCRRFCIKELMIKPCFPEAKGSDVWGDPVVAAWLLSKAQHLHEHTCSTHVIASRWSALPETAHARVSSLSLSSGSARKGCSPGVLGFSPYADGILILNDKPANVQQALGPILVKTPPFVCGSLLLRFVAVRC